MISEIVILFVLFLFLWWKLREQELDRRYMPVMQLRALPNNMDQEAVAFLEAQYTPIRHLYALIFLQRTNVGWDWRCERCARQGLLTGHGWTAQEMHFTALSIVSVQKGCPMCGIFPFNDFPATRCWMCMSAIQESLWYELG